MAFDFSLAVSIAEKALLVGVGAVMTWLFERRPRLTVFFTHVGEFRMTSPPGGQQQPMTVTHTPSSYAVRVALPRTTCGCHINGHWHRRMSTFQSSAA
jgi:hypothetical protein